MKIVNQETLDGTIQKFSNGELVAKRIVKTPNFGARIAIIAPNSEAPDRPHQHERYEMHYVMKGTATVSNGKETKEVKTGDFIVFDRHEEHYFTIGKGEAILFEIKWK